MNELVKNVFRLAIFIVVQVFILNKIPPLHRFVVPYLYFLFLLWLPFTTSRFNLLLIGFITGLSLDYFKMTPGLHTSACLLIAFVRPYIINILIPKETKEFNYLEPSPQSLGWPPYLIYTLFLTFLHHAYLVTLEWLQFGSFLSFVLKILATTAISMLLIITVELLFPRKLRYRTNIS